jgi:hypothetical protein
LNGLQETSRAETLQQFPALKRGFELAASSQWPPIYQILYYLWLQHLEVAFVEFNEGLDKFLK